MMKYLNKDIYWENFIDKNGKFIGNNFEIFISKLLPIISSGNWIPTKQTRDGAKDFFKSSNNFLSWAECKAHKNSISLAKIASTLVMAINEDVGEIYFISYSEITKDNYKQLAIFQKKSGKKVFLFDDIRLEQLILSNESLLKKFFPKFKDSVDKVKFLKSDFVIDSMVAQDPDFEYEGRFNNYVNLKELNVYQTFCIDIFIKNNNPKDTLKLNISFKNSNEFLHYLKPLNKDKLPYKKKITKAGVFFERFYFQTLMPIKSLPLPQFLINDKTTTLGKIKIRKSLEVELKGEEVIKFKTKIRNIITGRQKSLFFHIYGESGTGKSRLINELKNNFYAEQFKVISFDTEFNINNSFKEVLKKSLCTIYGLPNIDEELEFFQVYDKDNNEIPKLVYEILYDKKFDFQLNYNKCLNFFQSILLTKRISLVIDNFQNVDDTTALFFKELYINMTDISSNSILLFCFNTDLLIKNSEAQDMHNNLLSYSNKQFINFKVKPFTKEDIDSYLSDVFGKNLVEKNESFSELYPIVLDLFYEKVEHKPLNIEQTIYYLLDFENDIIGDLENLYIKDIDKFTKAFEEIPKDLEELLEKRWQKLIIVIEKSLINEENISNKIKDIMYFLTLLVITPQYLFYKFSDKNFILEELIERGIFKYTIDNKIAFYHNQLFLFFKKKFKVKEYLIAKKIYEVLNIENRDYLYQYFILATITNKIDKKLMKNIFIEYVEQKPSNQYEIEFADILYLQEKAISMYLNPKEELKIYETIGHTFKYKKRYDYSIEKLSIKFFDIQNNLNRFYKYGDQLLSFIHEYSNSCFSMHHDKEALDALEYGIENIDTFLFSSKKEKQLILSKILNRQCVAYKSLNKIEESIKSGEKSLNIAIKNDFEIMKMRNYIDLGNTISKDESKKDLLIEYWNNAYEIFDSNKDIDNEIKDGHTMVILYKGQTLLMEGKLKEALEIVNDAIEIAKKNKDYFFGVKLLLLKSIILIISNKNNLNDKIEEIKEPLDSALSMCIEHQGNRSYWMVFFMYAKISLIKNDIKKASNYYNNALEQLIKISTNEGVEEFYSDFFDDIIINKNQYKLEINKNIIKKIKSKKIQKLFKNFDKEKIQKSIFTFEYGNLPNP